MKKLNRSQTTSIKEHAPKMMKLLHSYIDKHHLDVHINGLGFGPQPKDCPCPPGQECYWSLDGDNIWQPNCS